ncbi:16S rRNA (cytosine(1402)-N(4))-methyltransferase RsmH [Hyphomicrobiales bacterium]|jgi:16S rRNA (cytosine1402-N4)-methyltransferase|nr:16S rRNA (cytosine(1402)-N(4))-methyltransferase RsmH [Rhodobiaceae bacterium]MBT5641400.1 16S rRNA (cytosine(1402)-N(4))-methyltransferase RsmH [Rhodobiaceae bacterium]MBT6222580.1 16S rRNA (cytosine(1402)-N(4))-methyltransferase RsmH [Rhodobiaceae bacterium]MDC0139214.1 16S rRNA (cytosine(1402)-N(4))-methyltransferase RsmH [Hyphomicrobiales bacterium]|tara:strand:+ start:685 stop:1725 length:1041 start_codon:yes stop_codon:yes gene_type:complete
MNSSGNAAGGPIHHIPVMLPEVLEALAPRGGCVYVDGTFGGGGYTKKILEYADCNVISLDRDAYAINNAKYLEKLYSPRLKLINSRFSQLESVLENINIEKVNGIVVDIGVSSMQLDDNTRGFSFQLDGPLDMRMDNERPNAYDVVNFLGEDELTNIIKILGEEKLAKMVARSIVRERSVHPIKTTFELREVVAQAIGWSYRKTDKKTIHPATRTFQAIRIFLNSELYELKRLLNISGKVLETGGRLVVVSFHSLEDRIVKEFLNHHTGINKAVSRHLPVSNLDEKNSFKYVMSKLIKTGEDEVAKNPRSRSARMRVGERTNEIFRENLDIYTNSYDYQDLLEKLR